MLVVFFELFPELTTFNLLSGLGGSQVELLGDTSSQIYESLVHLSSVEHFVGSMKLGVSLLHEWYPELVVVRAVPVENGLALAVVGDSRINDNVLPSTILEELEHGETVLDTIVDNKVV